MSTLTSIAFRAPMSEFLPIYAYVIDCARRARYDTALQEPGALCTHIRSRPGLRIHLSLLELSDVERAAERIAQRVRRTSLIEAGRELSDVARCHLVLEFLRHTGSFKPRGAT